MIGANDVTNPAARTDPGSPIHGMPILDVDRSRSVIVLKRSMSSGFAGIDNPLFYAPHTSMLFGDAKSSVMEVTEELGALTMITAIVVSGATHGLGVVRSLGRQGVSVTVVSYDKRDIASSSRYVARSSGLRTRTRTRRSSSRSCSRRPTAARARC